VKRVKNGMGRVTILAEFGISKKDGREMADMKKLKNRR